MEAVISLPSTLYVDRVNEYHLLFNTKSDKGVTVVNDTTFQILEWCKSGITFGSLCTQLSGIDEQKLKDALERLALFDVISVPWVRPKREPRVRRAHIWVHLTERCNLRCKYCYVKKCRTEMSPDIAVETVRAGFNSISQYSDEFQGVQFVVAGGEPFLNLTALEALAEESRKLGIETGLDAKISVITNGTLFSRRIVDLLQKYGVRISISLDDLGIENSDRICSDGSPSGSIVASNLGRFRQEGLEPFVLITVSKANIEALPDLTTFLSSEAYGLRYSPLKDLSSGDNIADQGDRLLPALDSCYDILEEDASQRLEYTPHRLMDVNLDFPVTRGCGIAVSSIRVFTDGRLFLCQSDFNQRPSVGSIFNGGIIEQIRSQQTTPNLAAFRSVDNIPVCQDCFWKNQCGGGCPLLTLLHRGSSGPSPYCNIFRRYIHRALRLRAYPLINKIGKEGR